MTVKGIIYYSIIVGVLSSCGGDSSSSLQVNNRQITPTTHLLESKKNNKDSTSIANVAGVAISADVLRYYLAQKGYGSRNKKLNKETLKLVLDEVISLELYKQAAIKHHLDEDPSVVLAMSRLLSNKYQTEILAKNSKLIQVTDEEIKARFDKEKQQYATSARRRGAIITVRINSRADKGEREIAKKKLTDISEAAASLAKENIFFGDLASRYSDDVVSKSRHGDIGWVVEGASINRYEPVIIKTLFSLEEPGDISPVVKGERGYYLVKLVGSIPAKQQKLEQVKRTIYQKLLTEKRRAAEAQIADELEKQFEVSVNDIAMNDFIARINTRNDHTGNMPPSFPVSVKTPIEGK